MWPAWKSCGEKWNDNELYAKILSEASIDGESNEEFDARALQILLSSEFEEEIDTLWNCLEMNV